jgi:DNA-binding Xre family transcriptional regulator
MRSRGFTTATQLREALLPHKVNLSRTQIGRYAAGQFVLLRPKVLDALCEVLSCEIGDLLVRDGQAQGAVIRGRPHTMYGNIPGSMQAEPLGKLGAVRPVGVRIRALK